jgi:hypothetical protein
MLGLFLTREKNKEHKRYPATVLTLPQRYGCSSRKPDCLSADAD